MKNKKGFLLAEETLKIIIAVVCIGFLIYFLVALYFNSKDSQELELAKASLKHLSDSINSNAQEVEIYNPKGWILASWPHKTLKGFIGFRKEVSNDIPKSCSNLGWTSCICMCGSTAILNLEGSDCDKKGTCMQSDFKVDATDSQIKLDKLPITIQINSDKKTIKKK